MPLHITQVRVVTLFPGFVFLTARALLDWCDEALYGVRLELHGVHEDWLKVRAEGAFGCEPDQLGPILGGALSPARPTHLTVQLLDEHTLPLGILCEAPIEILARILLSPLDSPLRDPSSWRLLSVMQPHSPKVSIGLTTRWFDEQFDPPRPLPSQHGRARPQD